VTHRKPIGATTPRGGPLTGNKRGGDTGMTGGEDAVEGGGGGVPRPDAPDRKDPGGGKRQATSTLGRDPA